MGNISNEAAVRLAPLINQPDTLSTKITFAVFLSVALYNSIELLVLILATFRHHHGTYFWSILLSTAAGVIPFSVGAIIDYFNLAPLWLILTLIEAGWIFMVGGQSVVLYSRLHLVSRNYRALRFLRNIIIVDTILLIIPTTVLYFGAAYLEPEAWATGYNIIDRLQLAWFTAQEFLISGFYIYETAKLIRLHPDRDRRRTLIIYQLLAINIAAILMDISLLVLEFSGLYNTQVILKAMVYSIKLKLEFAILGQLVYLVTTHHPDPVDNELSTVGTGVEWMSNTSRPIHAHKAPLKPTPDQQSPNRS